MLLWTSGSSKKALGRIASLTPVDMLFPPWWPADYIRKASESASSILTEPQAPYRMDILRTRSRTSYDTVGKVGGQKTLSTESLRRRSPIFVRPWIFFLVTICSFVENRAGSSSFLTYSLSRCLTRDRPPVGQWLWLWTTGRRISLVACSIWE